MRSRSRLFIGSFLLLCIAFDAPNSDAQTVPGGFAVETIHSSPGEKAVGFALLPDERILVITKETGEVRLIVDGDLKEAALLQIAGLEFGRERGLLGIAVDPDYPESNYLYLYYSSGSGTNRVSRFTVEGALTDPVSTELSIDPASEQVLIEMVDTSELHNAGTLRFGNDKTLYISHGDDLSHVPANEPYLQDLGNLYGKILRINRDGTVPGNNPTFTDNPGSRPEIFAVGLRNPFRFSVDPVTDRLFIADVGSTLREEFNLAVGGENFGYPKYEGSDLFREDSPLVNPVPTEPIYDYPNTGQASAIAVATYRPVDYPNDYSFPEAFDGVHFYVDFFNGALRYLRPSDDAWESVDFGSGFSTTVDGAVGPDGSLYVLRYGGPLLRISYENPSMPIDDPPVADAFTIHPNHPNPFVDRTTISYRLSAPGQIRLDVFDVLGRRVATLVDEWQQAGAQSVHFSAAHLPVGTYLCRLQAGSRTAVRTMVKR